MSRFPFSVSDDWSRWSLWALGLRLQWSRGSSRGTLKESLQIHSDKTDSYEFFLLLLWRRALMLFWRPRNYCNTIFFPNPEKWSVKQFHTFELVQHVAPPRRCQSSCLLLQFTLQLFQHLLRRRRRRRNKVYIYPGEKLLVSTGVHLQLKTSLSRLCPILLGFVYFHRNTKHPKFSSDYFS